MIFITTVLICIFLASPAVSTNPWFSEPIPNVTVTEGSDVSLPCAVNDLGNYKVAWIKPDRYKLLTLHHQVIARNPRLNIAIIGNHTFWLNIRDVQETDRGPYQCQINTSPMIDQIGYIEVIFPKLSSPEATDLRVETGSSFNLTCTMGNLADKPAWVNWLRGVQEDDGSGEEFYSIDDGTDLKILPLEKVDERTWISRLYLTNAQPEDSGKYQCEIPLLELVFNVQVLNVPKLSSPEATDLRVEAGSSFNLTCTMGHLDDEPAWVNWLRGVQEDDGSGEEFYSIDDGTDGYYKGEILPLEKVDEHTWISRLYLTNAQPEDSGKYQCEIPLHELVFNVQVLNVQTPTSDGCPMPLHNWILLLLMLILRGSWSYYQKQVYKH